VTERNTYWEKIVKEKDDLLIRWNQWHEQNKMSKKQAIPSPSHKRQKTSPGEVSPEEILDSGSLGDALDGITEAS
jgi:hypothetical protein